MNLLINELTKQALENFIARPSHSLIIEAPEGTGKISLAQELANQLLGLDKPNPSQIKHLSPVEGVISIDAIRELQNFLKLKSLGKNHLYRAVIIEDADRLTKEAQNSLLKTLEEPPSSTVIIMTTSHTTDLLPTIKSRAQSLTVRKVPKKAVIDNFIKLGYKSEQIDRVFKITDGRIGLMHKLLYDDEYTLTAYIDQAKQLLAQDPFDRLKRIEPIAKDRNQVKHLLEALEVISSAGLKATAQANKLNQVKRWHKNLTNIINAKTDLGHQANTKILLTDLLMNL